MPDTPFHGSDEGRWDMEPGIMEWEGMTFRRATVQDAPGIAGLMREAQGGMPDRSMYVIDSQALIEGDLESGRRFGYVAQSDGALASFFLFATDYDDVPEVVASELRGIAGHEDHPSHDGRLLLCDIVATRSGRRQGGLASSLLRMGMEDGREMGCLLAWAAVDPRNAPSLALFASEGFVVRGEERMFSQASGDFVIGDESVAIPDGGHRENAGHAATRLILVRGL
jgi:ribosomal protein S18 acetylase RimI-like enzyme